MVTVARPTPSFSLLLSLLFSYPCSSLILALLLSLLFSYPCSSLILALLLSLLFSYPCSSLILALLLSLLFSYPCSTLILALLLSLLFSSILCSLGSIFSNWWVTFVVTMSQYQVLFTKWTQWYSQVRCVLTLRYLMLSVPYRYSDSVCVNAPIVRHQSISELLKIQCLVSRIHWSALHLDTLLMNSSKTDKSIINW